MLLESTTSFAAKVEKRYNIRSEVAEAKGAIRVCSCFLSLSFINNDADVTYGGMNDMTRLDYLHEPAVLHEIYNYTLKKGEEANSCLSRSNNIFNSQDVSQAGSSFTTFSHAKVLKLVQVVPPETTIRLTFQNVLQEHVKVLISNTVSLDRAFENDNGTILSTVICCSKNMTGRDCIRLGEELAVVAHSSPIFP
ncbi:hypothetical protein Tco_0924747 [Tanacetum coccineum]|uniref:Uncharacterized protein n=1 Tax=Tanacetum coccineum TaxID=301880 RepID=A0ABQ5D5Q0_9ASTR